MSTQVIPKEEPFDSLIESTRNVKISCNESKGIGLKEEEFRSPEKVRKHSLQNAWTLWFFKNDKSKSWEENQRPIITLKTVEDFWFVYNHVEVASRLPVGSDYSLFKEGIFPAWEDKRNEAGGRWLVSTERRQRETCLDSYWLEIVFFMIGEQAGVKDSDQINGAVVNIRGRMDKLALWLADAEEEESVRRIGKALKHRLAIGEDENIGFNVHSDEKANPGSSIARKKFYV